MAQDAPILGQGLGSYKVLYFQFLGRTFAGQPVPELMHHRYVQAHNDFVQAAGETGWLGLLIILGVLGAWAIRLIRDSLRHLGFSREDRVLVWGGVTGVLAVSGSAIFGFPFHLAAVSTLLLVIASLAHGTWVLRTTDRPRPPSPLEDDLIRFTRTLAAPVSIGILSLSLALMFGRVYEADHHVKSAQELYRQGRVEETRVHLDAALSLDPERGDARLLRGLLYAMNEQFDASLAEFRSAERSYDDVTLHYYMGRVYEAMRQQKQALDQYRYALEVFPAGQEITELVRKRIRVLTGQPG
jgi:tetratricopeptide (TPR) repeat protein